MFHQNLSLCLSSARNGVGESYTALLVLGPIIVLSVAFSLYFILWRKKGRRELPDADLPLIPSLAMARESPHFKLVRGIEVTDLGGIHECYMAKLAEDGHSVITVNVSAERLPEVIPALMKEVGGLPEFVVQLPCTEEVERTLRHRPDDPWHSDIFRMENVAYEYLVGLLGRYGELLLHDGWATFHYGVLATPYDAVC
ncbi:MAG: hypothetical protein NT049_00470, partial [Planctomycetota bacterium]|nr:hypothetical protein [Planctomycetota bacterium]